MYVDGFTVYYGARSVCGRGSTGWRWLDIRALVNHLITRQGLWSGSTVQRIVYCTARVDAVTHPDAHTDQDVYLKALAGSGSVGWIEYGNYVARVKSALLAVAHPVTGRPTPVQSDWPVQIRHQNGKASPKSQFLVQYLQMEEKGSDVNVVSHLLLDVLDATVDAALVISNDSDLAMPLIEVRKRVPVATVNPQKGYTGGSLKGSPNDGVGGHWCWKIAAPAYRASQLPNPAGGQRKPVDW